MMARLGKKEDLKSRSWMIPKLFNQPVDPEMEQNKDGSRVFKELWKCHIHTLYRMANSQAIESQMGPSDSIIQW